MHEPRRLRNLPRADLGGWTVPVAEAPLARLLGLAHLPRELAGAGLLIPRCRSVHTFGMRFALDVVFLGLGGEVLARVPGVGPRRIVRRRDASAVLEVPA